MKSVAFCYSVHIVCSFNQLCKLFQWRTCHSDQAACRKLRHVFARVFHNSACVDYISIDTYECTYNRRQNRTFELLWAVSITYVVPLNNVRLRAVLHSESLVGSEHLSICMRSLCNTAQQDRCRLPKHTSNVTCFCSLCLDVNTHTYTLFKHC